jgi:hypothetical protein
VIWSGVVRRGEVWSGRDFFYRFSVGSGQVWSSKVW